MGRYLTKAYWLEHAPVRRVYVGAVIAVELARLIAWAL
jgi:hypothetical protein